MKIKIIWIQVLFCCVFEINCQDKTCESKVCEVNCTGGQYTRFGVWNCKKMKFIHFGFNNLNVSELKKLSHYTVTKLYLNDNNFISIPALSFKNVTVTDLLLFNNSIFKVNKKSFEGISRLEVLSLAYNKIKYLDKNSIPDAKIIHLNNNLIEAIDESMFVKINSLKQLSLHCNNLRTLEGEMKNFVGTKVVLDYNNIDYLSSKSIPASNEVYLKNNALTIIHAKHFVNISVIKFLDLSRNKIVRIADNAFLGSQLNALRLNNNNISTIELLTFAGIEMLDSLSMSNNSIQHLASRSIPKSRQVNLRYNLIETIDSDVFKEVSFLQSLDLRYNCIMNLSIPKSDVILYSNIMNKRCKVEDVNNVAHVFWTILYVITIVTALIIWKKRYLKRFCYLQQQSKEMGKEDVPEAYGFQVNEYEEIAIDHSRHYDYPSRDSKENEFYGLNINNNNNQL